MYNESVNFNPRSPCGERHRRAVVPFIYHGFQSTLPVRGATAVSSAAARNALSFQSTLPVRGATFVANCLAKRNSISIHAPRAGSDFDLEVYNAGAGHFNPRSPCGERLRQGGLHGEQHGISIHAPRAGSDGSPCQDLSVAGNFNPRSPCGERPSYHSSTRENAVFQSTLPVRGATLVPCSAARCTNISIHAPRAGSDYCGAANGALLDVFQSTLPVRGATKRRS